MHGALSGYGWYYMTTCVQQPKHLQQILTIQQVVGLWDGLCRCDAPERWCADLQKCSVKGLCVAALAALSSSTTTAAVKAYVPPVDKSPPKLRLLGTGTAAITPTGAAIMMDNVTWNSVWKDPGATAVDEVDGDLTGDISTFGAGALDGNTCAVWWRPIWSCMWWMLLEASCTPATIAWWRAEHIVHTFPDLHALLMGPLALRATLHAQVP
jgi:hypothetical protein